MVNCYGLLCCWLRGTQTNSRAVRDHGSASGPQHASASPLVCSVCGVLSAVSSLPASVLWVQVAYFTCALVEQLAGAPVLCSAETAHVEIHHDHLFLLEFHPIYHILLQPP